MEINKVLSLHQMMEFLLVNKINLYLIILLSHCLALQPIKILVVFLAIKTMIIKFLSRLQIKKLLVFLLTMKIYSIIKVIQIVIIKALSSHQLMEFLVVNKINPCLIILLSNCQAQQPIKMIHKIRKAILMGQIFKIKLIISVSKIIRLYLARNQFCKFHYFKTRIKTIQQSLLIQIQMVEIYFLIFQMSKKYKYQKKQLKNKLANI
ncbi:transmembrane protein, putative (macronuclear) [Tetrahymena thermophila SB210]|uniref:Transmembrane protein, putative n=1 Tax=Tetrahymena thermophila (strain SB210) TaxID=312017 RepID=W7X4U2_TETTS|nr:transmembrane protein, putative [Tetrahymena thermophila SB210]EWS74345.1 transmembrane protein, putative [Tetrahymena thermophila SB210]|eukprot:XP_012653166.1 transmembrane protein, putative [Tetrahymena thermophila SB210]